MSYHTKPLIFEEHSAVLVEWWQRGLRAQTLVYLDAHLDLQYIGNDRLKKLLDADSVAAIKSLEKPSQLLPDGDFVHSLENFLYPASRLGIVNHLIWIPPPHIDVGLTPSVIEHVQQMDGITLEELTNFRQSAGGWLEGTLAGLKITICRLEHLVDIEVPNELLLDIDTDFFVALPQDCAWIDPAQAYHILNKWLPKPNLITISRSVSSGFMPLCYRYFADYLAALFEHNQAIASHFKILFQLQHDTDNRYIRQKLSNELESHPDCAATHYIYAKYATDPEPYQIEAARLCSAYVYDPFQIASETANRHLATPIQKLDQLVQVLDQLPQSNGDIRFVALGLAYAELGASGRALACYQLYGLPHPALALAIAEQLIENTNHHPQLINLLITATTEDASTTLAHQLLATLYLKKGNVREAITHYKRAHERAPAWLEPLRGLAQLYTHSSLQSTKNPFKIQLVKQINALRALTT